MRMIVGLALFMHMHQAICVLVAALALHHGRPG
jgi:hypothetical protein